MISRTDSRVRSNSSRDQSTRLEHTSGRLRKLLDDYDNLARANSTAVVVVDKKKKKKRKSTRLNNSSVTCGLRETGGRIETRITSRP